MSEKSAVATTRPSLPLGVGLLLVLLGTTWAGVSATRSDSWNTACYEANVCDGLTFVVVAELLEAGLTPYDAQVKNDHVSTTRFQGNAVPFDLPFQYPPNSLPIFAARSWVLGLVITATTIAILNCPWSSTRSRVNQSNPPRKNIATANRRATELHTAA